MSDTPDRVRERFRNGDRMSCLDIQVLIEENAAQNNLLTALTAYREALADEEDIEDGPAHPPRPNWAMKAGALFDQIMAKSGVKA